MQGFNKYYPPDYDGEKHGSLNSYRGKHALGDRARKIDQGILITRFELPFNIWCDTCNNHIGMGVRYNAEKKKIGLYYSTPIFSFRCKCHLCDGWFEIQTDPQNTRYVVTSGARRKDEDWNPEENGGFAIHDPEGSAVPGDPFANLEKTADAQTHLMKVEIPRLELLQSMSQRYNSDPYTLSAKVRKRFREDKKLEKERKVADDQLKGRYGLSEALRLIQDDDRVKEEAKEEWAKGRYLRREEESKRRRQLPREYLVLEASGSASPGESSLEENSQTRTIGSLRSRVLGNTARRSSQLGQNRHKSPNRRLLSHIMPS